MRLIIATKNKSKFREIKEILKGLKIEIISLNQLNKKFRIREDGNSFLENAIKKAIAISRIYKNNLVAADDSGLEVDYLKGAPGIKSRRYCGRNSTYVKNNLKLLKQLKGVGQKARCAHFRCCLALLKNCRTLKIFEGKLSGFINKEIKGKGGFGYDPVFYLPQYKKTVAQLSLKEKNRISHRAKAFRKLEKYLKWQIANG